MDKQPGRSARDCIGDRDSFHGFRENEKSKKYFYHLLSGLAYWHDRGKYFYFYRHQVTWRRLLYKTITSQ